MRILFCGDVVGRPGRDILSERLPDLREELALDLVIVNGENAAGGFGITPEICKALYQVGADVITLGNHAWDQRGTERYIETDRRLIRARNYPKGTPGSAGALLHTQDGRSVFVFQVLTQLFMDPIGEPFACVEETLQEHRLGQSVDAIVLDVHGEATSEKQALAYLADGRVSLAVGTHTHVPTADHHSSAQGHSLHLGRRHVRQLRIDHRSCRGRAARPLYEKTPGPSRHTRRGRSHPLRRLGRDRRQDRTRAPCRRTQNWRRAQGLLACVTGAPATARTDTAGVSRQTRAARC